LERHYADLHGWMLERSGGKGVAQTLITFLFG
jgi:hypothetical protein